MHEKSILLPLLPATLLAIDYPVFAGWFGAIATFRWERLLYVAGAQRAVGGAWSLMLCLHAQHVSIVVEGWPRCSLLALFPLVPEYDNEPCVPKCCPGWRETICYRTWYPWKHGKPRPMFSQPPPPPPPHAAHTVQATLAGCVMVHVAVLLLPPKVLAKLPDLGAVMISAYSCSMFLCAWAFGNHMLLRRRRVAKHKAS